MNRLSKKPWRVRESRSSLELLIVPGGVYGGYGTIESGGKSYFPEQKSFPCSFCARKSERFFAKTGRGGSGGGDSSPVHQLVKKTFLTSCSWQSHEMGRHLALCFCDDPKAGLRAALSAPFCVRKRAAGNGAFFRRISSQKPAIQLCKAVCFRRRIEEKTPQDAISSRNRGEGTTACLFSDASRDGQSGRSGAQSPCRHMTAKQQGAAPKTERLPL